MKHWRNTVLALAAALSLGFVARVALAGQEHMHAALVHLHIAKMCGNSAADNKGGWKKAAMDSVELAIKEVREGITYDKTHTSENENQSAQKEAEPAHAKLPKNNQAWMQAMHDELVLAKKELNDADADKGGHRKNAIDAIDIALKEVQKGVEHAKDK